MDEPEHAEPPSCCGRPPRHDDAPVLCAHWLDPDRLLTPAQTAWLEDASARVLDVAASRFGVRGELRVRVVDDRAMTQAHRRHCELDSTTDVLTFDLSESEHEIDTDVLVCLDEGVRRAGELGHPPERELLLYALHALLHCVGHDDHDPEAYQAMHALEDELLERAGVGATFHAAHGAPHAGAGQPGSGEAS
ncbi:MAG: rRNA maturation RNase YbeY [Phycisphaerales bacterium JB040]